MTNLLERIDEIESKIEAKRRQRIRPEILEKLRSGKASNETVQGVLYAVLTGDYYADLLAAVEQQPKPVSPDLLAAAREVVAAYRGYAGRLDQELYEPLGRLMEVMEPPAPQQPEPMVPASLAREFVNEYNRLNPIRFEQMNRGKAALDFLKALEAAEGAAQ